MTRLGRHHSGSGRALVLVWLLGLVLLAGCAAKGEPALPTPEAMSAEMRSELVKAEELRALENLRSAYPDVEVPNVSRVRFVTLDEWPNAIADCLNEEGFDVTVEDGGVGGLVLDEQRRPYAVSTYTCKIKYPVDPKFSMPFNVSQLNYLYDYYEGELTACLEEAGYSITEPPSRQAFIESYGAGNWAPYNDVQGAEDWTALNRQCPQNPDGLFG